MARSNSDGSEGQLAFIGSEHAKEFMPAGWRFTLHENEERAAVQGRWPKFRSRIASLDRHDLLSLTGLYVLIGSAGSLQREGIYPEAAELEFLQAIALGSGEVSGATVPRVEVSGFWKELMSQCYVANTNAQEEEAKSVDTLARSHTAYYRNPYGADFFDRMILSITGEYDERFVRNGSVKAMGRAIVALRVEIWDRFQRHQDASHVALKGSRAKVISILRRIFAEMSDAQFNDEFGRQDIRELRMCAFQALENDAVRHLFILDEKWIARQELSGEPMAALLQGISTASVMVEQPFALAVNNPIWNAPVIRTDKGYALYSLVTLMSFPFRYLLTLLKDDPKAKSRIENIRGKFVEREGQRILAAALPSAKIVSGGYWQRTASERVEADLVVLVANRLLIFEAKGALIPDRVRHGVRDATTQFLRSIWGKATRQSAALAEHIANSSDVVAITDAKGNLLLQIDPKTVRSISRYGISVEQVGPLMNSPDILEEVGVLNNTNVAAPCIILSELDQIFNHSPSELQILHYLLRRCDVAKRYQIVGDEMDIYTTYLQFGFSSLPSDEYTLMMLGASYTLHEYLNDRGEIVLPSDSALRNSPFFDRVLKQARMRSSEIYLETGLILMDMPLGQQKALEVGMGKTFGRRPKDDDWPVAMSPIETPGEKEALGIVMVDWQLPSAGRRQVGFDVLGNLIEHMEARTAVCIVRLWKSDAAYDAIYFGGQTLNSARERRNGDMI